MKMSPLPFVLILSVVGWTVKLQGQGAVQNPGQVVQSPAAATLATHPKTLPKDVPGYMEIPWGTSSDQALQSFFNGENQGYGSCLSTNEYQVDVNVNKFGYWMDLSFFFTPDKTKLWMVQLESTNHIKGRDLDHLEQACLAEMTTQFGPPAGITRQEFDGGAYIMRHWRFPSTKILFGRLREGVEPSRVDRFIIRYMTTRKHRAEYDLRGWLFPYQARADVEPTWKMMLTSEPKEITPAEDKAILNGDSKAKK